MATLYDILVLGAGPGGHAVAVHAAKLGAHVMIVEKDSWGGTCTHRGCIPTKALLTCSLRYADLKKLGRFGVRVTNPTFEYAMMKKHQERTVKISTMGVEKSLKESGAEIRSGEGRIVSPGEVELTAPDGRREHILARNLVIAWGSEPVLPPGVSLSERILTSEGILSLQTLPKSIIVVGGNIIGVEFATLFAELGVQVILIEKMERILPGEEPEAAALLVQELKQLGVTVYTNVQMETIQSSDSHVHLLVSNLASGQRTPQAHPSQGAHLHKNVDDVPSQDPLAITHNLFANYALICTGRKPKLRIAELNALGIRHEQRGIAINERMATNVPGIFAVGDVTGGMMLAHRAMQQGKTLAYHLCGCPGPRFMEGAVPAVVYTHPQIARVGLTEAEAARRGIATEAHWVNYGANITARTQLMNSGFVKTLFDRSKLLGVTIVGDQAGDLIASFSLAMSAGLDRKHLEEWIIAHPTLSELLNS